MTEQSDFGTNVGCILLVGYVVLCLIFPILFFPVVLGIFIYSIYAGFKIFGEPFRNNQANHIDAPNKSETGTPKKRSQEKPAPNTTIDTIVSNFQRIKTWHEATLDARDERLKRHGWLSKDFAQTWQDKKPKNNLSGLDQEEVTSWIASRPPEERIVLANWKMPFADVCEQKNKAFALRELKTEKAFFDNIESSPLTDEQASAVLCFDGRVRVIASAGSGKTSTLIAKAAFAIKKGYFQPDEVLILAFNRVAADELDERVRNRFLRQGMNPDDITAQTFHSFGLRVLAEATKRKPSVAPWLDQGREIEELQDIVSRLKNEDPSFRERWDLFKWVFPRDISRPEEQDKVYDSWDPKSRSGAFWTLKGENVKSEGERFIANLLFFYGIEYEYERPYEIETADQRFSQYKPDFYLTDLESYLEHWAIDENGEPPESFHDYSKAMEWKKKLHVRHGTILLETTYGDFITGRLSDRLLNQLVDLGANLNYDPNRKVPGRQPITDMRLLSTMRTFMSHVKGNSLSIESLKERFDSGFGGNFHERKERFLSLFEMVWNSWEDRLDAGGFVDFDDMLSRAADAIEGGKWRNPYRLILVDEFQDTSQARARLLKKISKKADSVLFTVGDDWQSVNRFAGSDLSLMTDFETHFGIGTTLQIGTTFRCPQRLCDISSRFIQQNPNQIPKKVESAAKSRFKAPATILRTEDEGEITPLVQQRLKELNNQSKTGRKHTVLILGRYNQDRTYSPRAPGLNNLIVEFKTVHASKGVQADHVIILNIISGTFGFPSKIEDDPIIQLAMPGSDEFPFSEERRLFYVALTRARHTVTMITVSGQESEFLVELVREHGLRMTDKAGGITKENTCPECQKGVLVEKDGRYGKFLSCSRFPSCRYSRSIPIPKDSSN